MFGEGGRRLRDAVEEVEKWGMEEGWSKEAKVLKMLESMWDL